MERDKSVCHAHGPASNLAHNGEEYDHRYSTDITFSFLVPKLYLGTQLIKQLYCEIRKAQLSEHVRSQVQLGNEKKWTGAVAHIQGWPPLSSCGSSQLLSPTLRIPDDGRGCGEREPFGHSWVSIDKSI
jgi:hypothetical protein